MDKKGFVITNEESAKEHGFAIPLYIHPAEHDLGIAEAIGFEKGHEAGRQLGMKQERALWNLSESTQEIMNTHPVSPYKAITNTKIEPTVVSYTHPVKEQELLAEIEALKSVVYWLKENRPEVWDDIQKWRKQ